MKRCLVTGGAGAIGSNLVRALLACGHRVTLIDDLSSGRRENLRGCEEARLFVGSILDEPLLSAVFAEPYDWIFHYAGRFANQNSVEHPEADLLTNGLGTLRMLEWARKTGVERFIFASSSCVYRQASGALTEDLPVHATDTPYAITKNLGEDYIAFFARRYGLPAVVLRHFNTYGPGEYPGPYRNVIPNWFHCAIRRQPLTITGTGEETRHFTYVEDAVQAILLAAQTPAALGETFNIAGQANTTIRELAELVNRIAGNPAGVVYAPRRSWDGVVHRFTDGSKARRILGYTPRVDLPEGLKCTYDWFGASVKV